MASVPAEVIPEVVARLRDAQSREPHPSVATRVAWLRAIDEALGRQANALCAAERTDLNKPEVETQLTEISLCRAEARFLGRRLAGWARPRRVRSALLMFPSRSRVMPEPRGVVAVFGTWNYPILLCLRPVLAALAAGNRVVLKPSERAPATSRALRELLQAAVGDDVVAVVEGALPESQELLRQRFDLLFYTGGAGGGRAVMRAAAEQLTPVVLEMGGKSPAIVVPGADLRVTAERIAWGKFLNAGQTCVAPDFVCVPDGLHDAFVVELLSALRRFYPDAATLARDYSKVAGRDLFDRLSALAAAPGAVQVGEPDPARLTLPPTVIPRSGWDDPAMRDEIFGPVLPVVAYADLGELLATLRARPSPLAVYLFGGDAATIERVRTGTRSGAIMVNDTVRHLSNPRLPFGGVGASGFGRYHGWYGFETFSHFRPVVERPLWFRLFDLFPPYGAYAERVRRWLS
ncbi:MAG TPA: aldehyde dehydrogenase family protein [Gemmatimonadaceae bacterium]|nr:aldehyde dehydrogenase family protein [Gemmatimonadaceae bacterium]